MTLICSATRYGSLTSEARKKVVFPLSWIRGRARGSAHWTQKVTRVGFNFAFCQGCLRFLGMPPVQLSQSTTQHLKLELATLAKCPRRPFAGLLGQARTETRGAVNFAGTSGLHLASPRFAGTIAAHRSCSWWK